MDFKYNRGPKSFKVILGKNRTHVNINARF